MTQADSGGSNQVWPLFLSVVLVLRNQAPRLEQILGETAAYLATLARDWELIVVDNASEDDSIDRLKSLVGENGLPNIQVFALTQEVDADTAAWVGLENGLGDAIAVFDPLRDDVKVLAQMLERLQGGTGVVFARNLIEPRHGFAYRAANAVFNRLYQSFHGVHLTREAPQCRLLARRVINFILQHPQPVITYRHLPATGGFSKVTIHYSAEPKAAGQKNLGDSIDRGIKLLVSTTRAPMRLVTSLSMFGAIANMVYSLYVVAIAIFKQDVAPGWVSLSLQQSGMFFLISLVLLVLGEYILHMASSSTEGPLYHLGEEFSSARITRREKLNVEEAEAPVAGRTGGRYRIVA